MYEAVAVLIHLCYISVKAYAELQIIHLKGTEINFTIPTFEETSVKNKDTESRSMAVKVN